MKTQSQSSRVLKWLRDNKINTAPLTGTDVKALLAAVEIIELYSYHDHQGVLTAFREVVLCMQEKTRGIAWHSIAMVMDWEDRDRVWTASGLPVCWHGTRSICAYEPEGIRLGLHLQKGKAKAA